MQYTEYTYTIHYTIHPFTLYIGNIPSQIFMVSFNGFYLMVIGWYKEWYVG